MRKTACHTGHGGTSEWSYELRRRSGRQGGRERLRRSCVEMRIAPTPNRASSLRATSGRPGPPEGQGEAVLGVGPPGAGAEAGLVEFGLDALAAELGRHLGAQLLPLGELDIEADLRHQHA